MPSWKRSRCDGLTDANLRHGDRPLLCVGCNLESALVFSRVHAASGGAVICNRSENERPCNARSVLLNTASKVWMALCSSVFGRSQSSLHEGHCHRARVASGGSEILAWQCLHSNSTPITSETLMRCLVSCVISSAISRTA